MINSDTLYNFIQDLFPKCRSITGKDTLNTLKYIKDIIPIDIKKVKTGTKVFDWEIPKEWNIKDAYISDLTGTRIIDFRNSNLHVLNYSQPVDKKISFKELKEHLYYIPEFPDWIPYRTSYYDEKWGFCLSYNQYKELEKNGDGCIYHVKVDSSLKNGYLNYGELVINGESSKEILFSTYVCHPSMCNDNLTGVSTLTYLAKYLQKFDTNYSYRFLFIPETIGSIAWLSLNLDKLNKIKGGLVVTCVGDSGNVTYKKSRLSNSFIDNIIEKVLQDSYESCPVEYQSKYEYDIREFSPTGSDERQYCSQGINLPVGCLTRTPYGEFDEYHTSADNLEFINKDRLFNSYQLLKNIIFYLENNKKCRNLYTMGEVNLGKRGLYTKIGGVAGLKNNDFNPLIFKWILNYSTGKNDLLTISNKSKYNFIDIVKAYKILLNSKLIEVIGE